jgi:hypothetical protein
METNNNETKEGAGAVLERRSEGVAGSSREVSKTDEIPPAVSTAGREDNGEKKVQNHVKKPALVERKTELSGCGMQSKNNLTSKSISEMLEERAFNLPPEELENHGELIFFLIDRIDRVSDKLDRKIDRLGRKVIEIEKSGRP